MNLIAISVIMSIAMLSMTAVSIGQGELDVKLPDSKADNPIILYVNEANEIPISPINCETPTGFYSALGAITDNKIVITPTEVTGITEYIIIFLECGTDNETQTRFFYEVRERPTSQINITFEPTIEVESYAFGVPDTCDTTSETTSISFGKIQVGKISTLNGTITIDNALENFRVWSYYVSASDWTFDDDDKVLFDNKYIEVFNPVRLESDGNTYPAHWQSLDFEIRNRQQTLPGESSDILFRVNLQNATNSDLATLNPNNIKGSFGIQGICPSS